MGSLLDGRMFSNSATVEQRSSPRTTYDELIRESAGSSPQASPFHLADPEDHAEEQQQRVEPADNDVCDEHSEPVQEQDEINNPGHHESDFGRGREGDENDHRCDAALVEPSPRSW